MLGLQKLGALVVAAALAVGCPPWSHHGPGPFNGQAPRTPEVFAPGVISSDQFEWRITFSPDGRTAFFGRSEGFFPLTRQATIMMSRYERGKWTEPEVAPFSGEYPDLDPFISPDGRTLYFSSIRPVNGRERTDTDIWMVVKRWDGSWSEPVHLGDEVNSEADELFASVDAFGTLYVASDRSGGLGGWDIYRYRPRGLGQFSPAENLGAPVNTAGWEFNPTITPDGKTLLFTGLSRQGGAGYGDIYVTRQQGRRGWSEPVSVGEPVNTANDEYHPVLSPNLDRLFYVVNGDLHQVSVKSLRPLAKALGRG